MLLAGDTYILVTVKDDIACEGDEHFYVSASKPIGVNVSDGVAVGTIPNQWYGQDCYDGWA